MIMKWGRNRDLCLKKLTYKTVMLMALASGSRCSELASLDATKMKILPDGIALQLVKHKKNKKSAELPGQLFIPRLKSQKSLCPCYTLEKYLEKTKQARKIENGVFRAMTREQKTVGTATIGRWLTDCIRMAGTDIKAGRSIAHTTRSMSTSAARNRGMSTRTIMKAAGWKTDNMFEKYYYVPEFNAEFGRKVLQ